MEDSTTCLSPPEFLQLVAEPIRWQLLQELARSDRRVHELTEVTGRAQNLVSYHLRELRGAGLVSARRSSADGRDTYYRAELSQCVRMFSAAGVALHPGVQLGLETVHVPARSARRRLRVLFLCTGNSARSQIAQALLEQMTGHRVDVRSAGSHPKVLHRNAVRVMAGRGVDISERTTTPLSRYSRMRFDHVITLCDKVREVCPEFPQHPDLIHWSVADPALEGDTDDASLPAFERTADELEERLGFFLARLAEPAQRKEHDHVG